MTITSPSPFCYLIDDLLQTRSEESKAHDSIDTCPAPVTEDRLTHYRTMLKVGVPLPAVERQMLKNGLNPAELNGPILDEATCIERDIETVSGAAVVMKTMRRRWHWSAALKADRAPPTPNGSVWTQCSEEDAHRRVTALSQARIQELFVRDIDKLESDERDSMASTGSDTDLLVAIEHPCRSLKTEKVQVMKGTKGTNLEFVVSRLKIPFAQVAKDINILTAMYLQDTDIKTILAMWPSVAEQVILDEFSGDFNLLGRVSSRDKPIFRLQNLSNGLSIV